MRAANKPSGRKNSTDAKAANADKAPAPKPPAKDKPKKRKKPNFEQTFVPIDRKSTLPDGETIDGRRA